ncbi:NUDIX hydrolase [Streptomyces sp. NBC_00335]|uniref:NUDIX hydrolase n=1 Tax=unclassified Streptomyces TaxID=2593676 RepID=UPI00225191F4|nr:MULTISPECIES: NUDIX hydrolase [unclassified Streptomyces]MCX5409161.1 NUDIX hydrolase [Streptomyces sp. NBC_00086]
MKGNAPPQHRVAGAVVVHEGRVLLVRRRVAEGQLLWQFPAGKVEPGESCDEAAVRETKEEAGLDVVPIVRLGERIHPLTNRQVSYTACKVAGGAAHVADHDEIAEVAWVTLSEIPQYIPYGLFTPVQQHLDVVLRS